MKIFSAEQIRKWDAFTIQHEPIASIDLMERAAGSCVEWLTKHFENDRPFKIFCGKGNNGGDGLAIARLLIQKDLYVEVFVAGDITPGSADFEINLKRLRKEKAGIRYLESSNSFPEINKGDIIVDALFGTGLNKKPAGLFNKLIKHINNSKATCIAIDIPSGLYTDRNSSGNEIVCADYTLTFQQRKLAFLMAENERFSGKVQVLDIGLSKDYYKSENCDLQLLDKNTVQDIFKPRTQFANKGDYGYACLVAGSYGMMGAAVLSARACLRSGVGKLTCYICKEGYTVMQSTVPEAMCKIFGTTFIKEVKDLKDFSVIGIGPGIGKHPSHQQLLKTVFSNFKNPLVIDADGLNNLSKYRSLYRSIPANSIITPHPKEFERLFGKSGNDFERMQLALEKAASLHIYIVLKGHHTFIATPEGKGYFNSTGNSGMATAGAGDVLTGVLTGFLAQKYSPLDAAILGVYLHGLAGDLAAKKISKEAMIAGDITDHLGEAFLCFEEVV